MNDEHKKKEYIRQVSMKDMKKILKVRMHMSKIPGNFKRAGLETCPLCKRKEGSTEHYFECEEVSRLREAWGVEKKDLQSLDIGKMKDIANFMEKVEQMVEPIMNLLLKNEKKSNEG